MRAAPPPFSTIRSIPAFTSCAIARKRAPDARELEEIDLPLLERGGLRRDLAHRHRVLEEREEDPEDDAERRAPPMRSAS